MTLSSVIESLYRGNVWMTRPQGVKPHTSCVCSQYFKQHNRVFNKTYIEYSILYVHTHMKL